MTNVPSNRDAVSLLVNGTISVVGSELLKANSCRMIAGRSPACAWPGAAGMSTRQISPFFIGFRLIRETFDHFDGAYLDLKNGNVDAVTSTKLNDRVLFEKNPGVFKVAFTLPIYNLVGVATRQPDTDLSQQVDAFIAEMKSSGQLAELQKKWFGYAMDLPQ